MPTTAFSCELFFDLPNCVVTNTTGGIFNGSISAVAIDLNGDPIKYNLNSDFDYATGGQTVGTFYSLGNGTYTVYARSSSSCRRSIELVINDADVYGIHYRFYMHDIVSVAALGSSNYKYRFDIEESAYVGAISEMIGGGEDPLVLSYPNDGNEDPFFPLIASNLRMSILSETEGQYSGLFTQDERKFKGKLYKWNGSSYDLYWSGWNLPMLREEEYVLKTNYPVNVTFTDSLRDLEGIEFSDDNGNFPLLRISMMDAIVFCLNKSALGIDIQESVNILFSTMDTSDDTSFLKEAYLDPAVFLNSDLTPKSCYDVLVGVLNGCRLYQSNGKWRIDLITQSLGNSLLVRNFDSTGLFVNSETLGDTGGGGSVTNPLRVLLRRGNQPSPKITFSNQSAILKTSQVYGTIKTKFDLQIESENNILEYGNFYAEDIANGQFLGWALDGLVYPITAQLIDSPGRPGDTCLSVRFNPYIESDPVTLIAQKQAMYATGANYKLKFSFDIYTIPVVTNTYIFFDFRLFIYDTTAGANIYLQHILDFSSGVHAFQLGTSALLDSEGWIRVYIDEHVQWKNLVYETLVDVDSYGYDIVGDLNVEFRFDNNSLWDVGDQTDLEAITTNNYARQNFDNRRRLTNDVVSPDYIYFYKLQPNTDAASFPGIVRPDDYGAYQWILDKTLPGDSGYSGWLQAVLIDNVKVEYLPNSSSPETSVTITETINTKVKPILEKTLVLGSIDSVNNVYNYQYISPSFLTDSDGVLITGFSRRGVTESYTYQRLIGKMMRGQYLTDRIKLTGSVDDRDELLRFDRNIYEIRSGKVYMQLSLVNHLRLCESDIEILEGLSGEAATDEGDYSGHTEGPIGGDPIEPPVTVGEFTSEFTTEFVV